MPPILVLFVFLAACWLIWILIGWLAPRLRDSVHITLAAAGIYALAFFVVLAFVVYMYGHLAGAQSGVLPQGYATPLLVLGMAMLIGLPGYAAYRFFGLCSNRRHKPPTVRRVAGHRSSGHTTSGHTSSQAASARSSPPPASKPPTVRRVPRPKPPTRP